MRPCTCVIIVCALLSAPAIQAASKPHTVSFGRFTAVKLFVGEQAEKPLDLKIRPLYVDGKLREFTTGEAHDITDQQFVIQRAYRVNDSLPQDASSAPKWKWQRGGWLLVNRTSGHISDLRLPAFDAFYSTVAWYREYAAYCGVSEAGDKLYAIVAQAGLRKPVLRKLVRSTSPADGGDECGRPSWQRQPPRVTFQIKPAPGTAGATDGGGAEQVPDQKLTFTVRGRMVDLATPADNQADED